MGIRKMKKLTSFPTPFLGDCHVRFPQGPKHFPAHRRMVQSVRRKASCCHRYRHNLCCDDRHLPHIWLCKRSRKGCRLQVQSEIESFVTFHLPSGECHVRYQQYLEHFPAHWKVDHKHVEPRM